MSSIAPELASYRNQSGIRAQSTRNPAMLAQSFEITWIVVGLQIQGNPFAILFQPAPQLTGCLRIATECSPSTLNCPSFAIHARSRHNRPKSTQSNWIALRLQNYCNVVDRIASKLHGLHANRSNSPSRGGTKAISGRSHNPTAIQPSPANPAILVQFLVIFIILEQPTQFNSIAARLTNCDEIAKSPRIARIAPNSWVIHNRRPDRADFQAIHIAITIRLHNCNAINAILSQTAYCLRMPILTAIDTVKLNCDEIAKLRRIARGSQGLHQNPGKSTNCKQMSPIAPRLGLPSQSVRDQRATHPKPCNAGTMFCNPGNCGGIAI